MILLCRWATGDDFEVWGWRIPFLVSVVLLAISVYIRLQLEESPAFEQIRAEGKLAKAPLTEAFANRGNLKIVLLALFGATAGQAVVWYAGQFYALFFLERTLQLEAASANLILIAALLIGTPFFVVFGALSDRIGRKTLVMTGCLLAVLTYFPTFKAARCSLQFDPVGKAAFRESCDVAKTALARAGVPYRNEAATAGATALVRIGTGATAVTVPAFEGGALDAAAFKAATGDFGKQLRGALDTAGYPPRADMSQVNYPMVIALCAWLVILVTLVYGPIAAWLVELFPTRIRYTSMSLPYHIGNGWFGGFLPVTSFAIVAATGDIYAGLWYPIVVALMTLVIGGLFLRDTHRSPLPE